jgi:hypothetical protein
MFEVTLNGEWVGNMDYSELIDTILALNPNDTLEVKKV